MGPYELLIVVGSIVIFGLVPPVVVGWWSFRQGKKGYNEAVSSRDAAFKSLDELKDELKPVHEHLCLIHDSMTVLEGSYEEVKKLPSKEELLNAIQKSVQGSYGQLLKGAKSEMEANLEGAAENIADKIPQEQKMAMIGQRMQSAIMEKVMGFLQ